MPGGKGNITPKDGKQFSSEYQPKQKWTEKKALKVGHDLIKWLKAEEENIFFEEFLYIENDYYSDLIGYLGRKFTSFLELINKAKKIQELKLVKFGVFDKLNATMTKFTLINNHDWKEKTQSDLTTNGKDISIQEQVKNIVKIEFVNDKNEIE
ncbi:MAG: hypothetical protein IMY67_01765 [Bacteroidetes bacterium]|nr:hypothetical protein [Bacteroidota bacterium]